MAGMDPVHAFEGCHPRWIWVRLQNPMKTLGPFPRATKISWFFTQNPTTYLGLPPSNTNLGFTATMTLAHIKTEVQGTNVQKRSHLVTSCLDPS